MSYWRCEYERVVDGDKPHAVGLSHDVIQVLKVTVENKASGLDAFQFLEEGPGRVRSLNLFLNQCATGVHNTCTNG